MKEKPGNYYAVFTKHEEGVEVFFPDFSEFKVFGFDLAHAYSLAFDELKLWLPADSPVPTPSSYEDIRAKYKGKNQYILSFPVKNFKNSGRLY